MDVPRARWGDYLLDEKVRVVLRRVNPASEREVVNDKLAFHEHCVANGLATIPILCAIDKVAVGPDKAGIVARSEREWVEHLELAGDRVFIKLIDGSWGVDAFIVDRVGERWHYCGETGSTADLYEFSMQRLGPKRGWVVQPLVRAHAALGKIMSPHALGTIRAVTCLADGETRVLFATLRIPVGGNVTDNFSHGSSGNIIAPVDLETGELGVCRGATSRAWPNLVEVPVHPDTGNPIPGFKIPLWRDVLALLDRGQQSLPALKTLGWDIAVTDNGAVIVEANATYDVDILQVSHQTGVAAVLNPQLEANDSGGLARGRPTVGGA